MRTIECTYTVPQRGKAAEEKAQRLEKLLDEAKTDVCLLSALSIAMFAGSLWIVLHVTQPAQTQVNNQVNSNVAATKHKLHRGA